MQRKPIELKDVINSSQIGLEFEFFTKVPKEELPSKLSEYLGKAVVIPTIITGLDQHENKYHSGFTPSKDTFKIEPDYSGGPEMYELVTGPMPFNEAKKIILRVFEWIKENGYTTVKSAIHLNISFNNDRIYLRKDIANLDKLKFILTFDEGEVFSRFPDREGNIYAAGIKQVYPINRYFVSKDIQYIRPNNYVVPQDKYYGVNFTKLPQNYLEYRFLGGEGYEEKGSDVIYLAKYFIEHLYKALTDSFYTKRDSKELVKILKRYNDVMTSLGDYYKFVKDFPDIEIYVDMVNNEEIIKAYWERFREVLFDLLIRNNMKKGIINLDKDVSRFQIKDAVIENGMMLRGYEIIESQINSRAEECWFYSCKIERSMLEHCTLKYGNHLISSKIKWSKMENQNVFDDCYIESGEEKINSTIEGGIIRSGTIGYLANISKETSLVDVKYEKDI